MSHHGWDCQGHLKKALSRCRLVHHLVAWWWNWLGVHHCWFLDVPVVPFLPLVLLLLLVIVFAVSIKIIVLCFGFLALLKIITDWLLLQRYSCPYRCLDLEHLGSYKAIYLLSFRCFHRHSLFDCIDLFELWALFFRVSSWIRVIHRISFSFAAAVVLWDFLLRARRQNELFDLNDGELRHSSGGASLIRMIFVPAEGRALYYWALQCVTPLNSLLFIFGLLLGSQH